MPTYIVIVGFKTSDHARDYLHITQLYTMVNITTLDMQMRQY